MYKTVVLLLFKIKARKECARIYSRAEVPNLFTAKDLLQNREYTGDPLIYMSLGII